MKITRPLVPRIALLALAILNLQLSTVFAQTNAFTYQGQLTENGSPVSGTYDLRFELFDQNAPGGSPQGGPVTNLAVAVSGGLFTVTLDFGSAPFSAGADRWLQIGSRTNGPGEFGTLAPRQQITSTPYAIKAQSAATNSGVISGGQITSGTVPDARIDSALARDAEVSVLLAGYQPLDPDLTDLADGTLSDGLLTGNVALLNRSTQTFTGTNIFSTRVGIGESSPLAPVHIQGSDIGLTSDAIAPLDAVVVEAADVVLGLFSNNSGGFGSGIALKEVVGGSLSNSWGIVRRTTSGDGSLRFSFGTNVNITGNSFLVLFGTNGTVTATAFNPTSDRNAKENFNAVSTREVLDKVAGLAITRWNFIGDTATPHVGPMAQDFHAAFGLGTDDKHIATVDADGVALAAIQGLNQKVEETRAESRAKDAEIESLKQSVAELKRQIESLATKK